MAKIPCLCFYVLLNILLVRGQTYTSVIQTTSGPVRGAILTSIENKQYAGFQGIPFAEPPVGYLRFKPPVAKSPWVNVYDAIADGNDCTQAEFFSNVVKGSEDCLYINVYTPHTTFNGAILKPVMFWIHGGGYTIGSSAKTYGGADYIVGKDVIFVSFNYRLGPLGFLNIEHENATGNCALKDQNLALRWTKKNIANFGGDPNKITISGQSAGSSAIDLQVISDMSSGLFSQSIAMSGSTLCLWWGIQKRNDALSAAFKLGLNLGTNTNNKNVLLQTLYSASATAIATAAKNVGIMAFRPTIENPNIAKNQEKFLTKCSITKYVTGNYTKGPHMLGFTSNESLELVRGINDIFDLIKKALQPINIPLVANTVNAILNGAKNLTVALKQVTRQINNLLFILGIDTKQKLISGNNNYPIYYYRFSFVPSNSSSNLQLEGAGHAADLPYIFHIPSTNLPNQPDVITTRKRMVELYTNFVKYGNPTPNGPTDPILGITWPDSRPIGEHLEIGKTLTTGPRPTDNFIKLLQLLGVGTSLDLNDCTNNSVESLNYVTQILIESIQKHA